MKKNKLLLLITVALLSVTAMCGGLFAKEYAAAREEISVYTKIQEEYSNVVPGMQKGIGIKEHSETDRLPYVNPDFDALLRINPETVGWIAIPDTLINYPVMQAKDNAKYLNYASTGEKSKTGAVFADCNNSIDPLDKNTVLYGHNMGAGRTDMFGMLLNYGDKVYYDAHKYIQFDTSAERHGWWKIFAVIDLDSKAGQFNYLRLTFKTNAEFMEWTRQAKTLSLYETGVDVKPGDKVIALSTCDRRNYGRNGRQLILAVKMNEGASL